MKKTTIFGLGTILVIIDQIIKYVVVRNLAVNDTIPILKNSIELTFVKNTGAAFSILTNATWLITALSVTVFIFLIYYIRKEEKTTKSMGVIFSLLIGGILGNIIDRIRLGYVIDYVSIGRFPIFNFADSCIVIGMVLMIIVVIRGEKNEKNHRA